MGDTFSGVNFEKGLQAVEELKKILPKDFSLSQLSLKWILMHEAVTVVIPGATDDIQVKENTDVTNMSDIKNILPQIKSIYEKYIKTDVDDRWL